MSRKTLLLLICGLMFTACNKKKSEPATGHSDFNCKTLLEKNNKCARSITLAAKKELLSRLSGAELVKEEARWKANMDNRVRGFKKRFAGKRFRDKCEAGWDAEKPKSKRSKALLKACYKKSCVEYADCFTRAFLRRR